jgi:sugar phosphate isomerase/epimerase
MKFSVITDELSADLDTALELAVEMGFDGVEIRGVGESRFPRVTELMRKAVPELCREYGLPVVSLSPGLFKIAYPQSLPDDARALRWDHRLSFDDLRSAEENFRVHMQELLPAAVEAAGEVGCPLINSFSFDRGGASLDTPIPQEAVEALKRAAGLAGKAGLILSIENEAAGWAATSKQAVELVERINEPNVGITWDPANAFRAGEDRPFPDGYRRVHQHIRHIHFKNARLEPRTSDRRFAFDGILDWSGQIAALKEDGYAGYISIETHQRPKLNTTRKYLEQLRSLAQGQTTGAV